jgi:hypothetical protein
MGVAAGSLREGEWTKLAGPDATYGEITAVHEVGHNLARMAHGDEDAAFEGRVDHEQAPTLYGASKSNEDYAESLTYLAYGQPIAEDREAIIRSDIERVIQSYEAKSQN